MSIPIAVGQPVPLFVSIEGDSDYAVHARIISRHPYNLLAIDVELESEYFEGDFLNTDFTMPDLPFIDVIYSIYDTVSMTLVRQEREVFVRRSERGDDGNITASIHGDQQLSATVSACS